MIELMTVLITILCVILMAVILIQNPKGGGVDSTFGGQSANQVFGAARSADFIEKMTWGLAIGLFILAVITTLLLGTQTGSGPELLSQ